MLLPTVLLLWAAVLHPSLGQTGSGISPEAQKEIVNKHNNIRSNVNPTASNMLKMIWDNEIATNAKKWADQCQLKVSPIEQRTIKGRVCGENVFMASYPSSWTNTIQAWYNGGSSNFKYGVGAIDPKKSIAGFTQLIWYNSYLVGCGVAHCPNEAFSYFYVCQYCPARTQEDLNYPTHMATIQGFAVNIPEMTQQAVEKSKSPGAPYRWTKFMAGGNIVSQMATPYKKGPSCGDCPNNCENKLCTNPCKDADKVSSCQQMSQLFSCKENVMTANCPATCNCKTEIK